ncbi:hypothetical protein VKT23_016886 [Stygiomarasmius scandens]|uniref:Uncharacterized protein n=1 Tax=Marasmiellus scandens TaxID=2682957 RepID=A0ABR1ITX3_9AGAR
MIPSEKSIWPDRVGASRIKVLVPTRSDPPSLEILGSQPNQDEPRRVFYAGIALARWDWSSLGQLALTEIGVARPHSLTLVE